ncbi:sodium:solute symporter [Flavihumibacter stibioxidans]|uniref:Sodium:solute symporter n=1 Tax=Flavihumibacter stibioxidans TaxID=1834163 RepID=A0ABR7M5M3_9BACT|nr:sodium:solute symporter [Flavihumibacter stibioxidans]MBC6490321.1 sodium:solute symporter [Flavihumibacter stibioxidans]
MSTTLLFGIIIAYFVLLLGVAYITSRNATNESFFIGNKNSNWMLVAFGMIGTSLSGVTFVSVPGTVAANAFTYMQVVFGYLLGYIVIAYVLLPLYYKLNLTSIYDYLKQRFGFTAYKTGALFFIISRTIGATARLYLVINVMQLFILDALGVPFFVTALVILLMILLYTFEGGVKTIVYTDTLQTSFMLLGLVVCVIFIMNNLGLGFGEAMQALSAQGYTDIVNSDANSKGFFLKQVIGGAFITIAMTGLDQEMMQKNISVKTLKDSQKNIMTFSVIIVFVNFLFLLLGGLLYLFAAKNGMDVKGDDLFPAVAMNYLPPVITIIFIIALISALFPSADGALTALTSSFCIDMLGIKRNPNLSDTRQKRIRMTVHLTFTVVFMICIMIFKIIDNKSIIGIILDLAGYTYGPLLGLFAFGILTRRSFKDNFMVTVIALLSPLISYVISLNAATWLGGFQIGIELLLINGLITFLGLLIISKKPAQA